MKSVLLAATTVGALLFGGRAHAVPFTSSVSGLTYNIEEQSINATTERFALVVSGLNVAGTDLEGGRTGLHSFAISDNSITGGIVQAIRFNNVTTLAPTGFTFTFGGLNANGCDGSGGFVCFNAPSSPPGATITSPTAIVVFDLVSPSGWGSYNVTALKLDWVGTKNNYDLLSKDITIDHTCPDCAITTSITPAPEPMAIAIMGSGLLGLGLVRRRREQGD